MTKRWSWAVALLLAAFLTVPVSAQSPIVRAVLFFSPTCPHCHQVMTQDLPPLQATYGEQLQIAAIDVTTVDGQQLYRSAVDAYSIPEDRLGVPTLIVGDQVMVGSLEIPELFPGLIEQGLARGGVEWPEIPGLPSALAGFEPASPDQVEAGSGSASWSEKLARDPVGNGLAIAVLAILVGIVGFSAWRWRSPGTVEQGARGKPFFGGWGWMTAVALVGLAAASYLAWAEAGSNQVACGPVGDCAAVQASPYSTFLGLPVAVLGVAGYVALLAAIGLTRSRTARLRQRAHVATLVLAAGGTLFSIYLTSLEPFVIGAACAWCLASALAMGLLLLLSVRPARAAYERLSSG